MTEAEIRHMRILAATLVTDEPVVAQKLLEALNPDYYETARSALRLITKNLDTEKTIEAARTAAENSVKDLPLPYGTRWLRPIIARWVTIVAEKRTIKNLEWLRQ